MKKLKNDKNESFNIISREKRQRCKESKENKECTWKTLKNGWKTTSEQGWMSLTSSSSLLCEKWKFSLYNDNILPKREAFSLPHFLTNFLLFSLMFSPGSCPNGLATCSSYSLRNVAKYKRQVSNHDSSIWILIQSLYYVVAEGERVSTPKSG